MSKCTQHPIPDVETLVIERLHMSFHYRIRCTPCQLVLTLCHAPETITIHWASSSAALFEALNFFYQRPLAARIVSSARIGSTFLVLLSTSSHETVYIRGNRRTIFLFNLYVSLALTMSLCQSCKIKFNRVFKQNKCTHAIKINALKRIHLRPDHLETHDLGSELAKLVALQWLWHVVRYHFVRRAVFNR